MKILLILCGDVETNPGPFPSLPSLPSFDKKDDPVTLLQIVVDEQSKKIRKSFSKTFFKKKNDFCSLAPIFACRFVKLI